VPVDGGHRDARVAEGAPRGVAIAARNAAIEASSSDPLASPVASVASLATIAATAGMSPSLDALTPDRRRLVETVEREARKALLDPRLVLR
jgi:hypothetical protein